MEITPQKILDDYSNQLIDKDSAIDQLCTLIESSNHYGIRLESIKILGMSFVVDNRIFSLLENLLVSDSNENIRISAASILKRDYNEKALKPLKWALSHETSPDSLKIILKTLIKIINHLLDTGSRNTLEREIKSIKHQEFKIGFEKLCEEHPIIGLKNQEFADILINFFTLTYLEKILWGVKYKLKDCKITQLDCQFKGLNEIPEVIENLRDIKELDLSYNRIKIIPAWIGQLSHLEELKIDSNNLSKIHSSIGKLKALKYLSFKENDLYELPEEIGKLKSLERLNCEQNRLTQVPDSMKELSKLKYLNISGNELKQLTKSLLSLKSLEEIYLGGNKISKLPKSLKKLEARGVQVYRSHYKHVIRNRGKYTYYPSLRY